MGHIRQQAKGSKENKPIQRVSKRAVPQSGCHGRGAQRVWPARARLRGPRRAGSWQLAGRRARHQEQQGQHTWMCDPGGGAGEVGGPLKLQAGVHQECRGPSCLGGVACARGRPGSRSLPRLPVRPGQVEEHLLRLGFWAFPFPSVKAQDCQSVHIHAITKERPRAPSVPAVANTHAVIAILRAAKKEQ